MRQAARNPNPLKLAVGPVRDGVVEVCDSRGPRGRRGSSAGLEEGSDRAEESVVTTRKLQKKKKKPADRESRGGASSGPRARRARGRSVRHAWRAQAGGRRGPRSGRPGGSQGVNPGTPETPAEREGRQSERKEPQSRLPGAQKQTPPRRGGGGAGAHRKFSRGLSAPRPTPTKPCLADRESREREREVSPLHHPNNHEAAAN